MLKTPAGREGQGAELVRGAPAERERQVAIGISTENTLAMSSRGCCTGVSGESLFLSDTLEKLFWNGSLARTHVLKIVSGAEEL